MPFQIRNPDYEAEARESFARQGLMSAVGGRLVHVGPGECDLAVDFSPAVSQQHGFFHGGITATFADTACGFAAFTLFEKGAGVLTVEFKINLLAPALGDTLVARGRVERAGRTLTVCRGDMFVSNGGEEKQVATGLFTMMQVTTVRG